MNINKFTQKSIEAINNCQNIISEYGNQYVEQVHLLYSLITIDDSLITQLLKKMVLTVVLSTIVVMLTVVCSMQATTLNSAMLRLIFQSILLELLRNVQI